MSRPPRRAKRIVLSLAQYRQTAREHDLQVSLIEYLRLHVHPSVHYFAIPNAAKRSWQTAKRMKAEGLTAGVADICIMLPHGKAAWLELKRGDEQQSAEQVAFELICSTLSHPYAIARTFDQAIAILRRWGALKEIR